MEKLNYMMLPAKNPCIFQGKVLCKIFGWAWKKRRTLKHDHDCTEFHHFFRQINFSYRRVDFMENFWAWSGICRHGLFHFCLQWIHEIHDEFQISTGFTKNKYIWGLPIQQFYLVFMATFLNLKELFIVKGSHFWHQGSRQIFVH